MAVPHWKTAIATAIAEHKNAVVIQLASVDPSSPLPFVRSHIFRDFLLPSSNPSLPLLVSTTDIRSPKTSQIISNPHVQLAWWIEATQEQFRVSGLAYLVPAPSNDLCKHFLYNIKIAAKGSAIATLTLEGFDWEEKRKEVFKGLSGHMKASWCRPVPGSRLEDYEQEKSWPGNVEEPKDNDDERAKQNWTTALENFALLVIEPMEVDYLELGIAPNRRTRFWPTKDGGWDSELLVP